MGKYTITRSMNNRRKREGTIENEISNTLPNVDDFGGDEYEYDLYMSQFPLIGGIYSARAKRLEYLENKQWWQDYARHTGIDLSKNKYPIRSGYYRGYSAPYSEVFEATEAIMSLYGWFKW